MINFLQEQVGLLKTSYTNKDSPGSLFCFMDCYEYIP
jgi:hypothetical protein